VPAIVHKAPGIEVPVQFEIALRDIVILQEDEEDESQFPHATP